MHRFYIHALLGGGRKEDAPGRDEVDEEEKATYPNSLKSLTDSAARNGKESRAHELVVFRYASRVLHRSFAALQSRRHRGAAMSRLRELRERIATIAPDRVSRLVGLGISRLLATELLRKQRWKECIQELNCAIYQCPLNSTRPINGLSEALVLLADAYAGEERFDEGIHSLCLAIDFAADQCEIDESPEISLEGPPGEDRIEGAPEHYSYLAGTNAVGPHLSPGHSLVLGLYAVACWAHARGLTEDAAQWFDRALQTAQKRCASNAALLSGLEDTLAAAMHVLSKNQRDVLSVSIDDAALSRYCKWKQAFLSSRAILHFTDARSVTNPPRPAEMTTPKIIDRADLRQGLFLSQGGAGNGANSSARDWNDAWRGVDSSGALLRPHGSRAAATDRIEKKEAADEPRPMRDASIDLDSDSYGAQIDAIIAKLHKSMDSIYYEISVTGNLINNFESRQQSLKSMFFARHQNSCRSVRLAKAHRHIRASPVVGTANEGSSGRSSSRNVVRKLDINADPREDSQLAYAVRVSAVRFRDEAASAMHSAADKFKLAALQGQVAKVFYDDIRFMTNHSRFAGIDTMTRAALAIQTATRRFLSQQLASGLLYAKRQCDDYDKRFIESQHRIKILFNDFLAISIAQKDGLCRAVDLIDRKKLSQDSNMLMCLSRLRDLASKPNFDRYSELANIPGGYKYDKMNSKFRASVPDRLASRIQFAFRRSRFQHRVNSRISSRNFGPIVTADAETSTVQISSRNKATETYRLIEMQDGETQCGDGDVSFGVLEVGYITSEFPPESQMDDSNKDKTISATVSSDAACQSHSTGEYVIAPTKHSIDDATIQTEPVLVLHATSQTMPTDDVGATIAKLRRIAGSIALGGMLEALETCTSIAVRYRQESTRDSIESAIAPQEVATLAAVPKGAADEAVSQAESAAPGVALGYSGGSEKKPAKQVAGTSVVCAASQSPLTLPIEDIVSSAARLRNKAIAEVVLSVYTATNQRCPNFVGDNYQQGAGLAAAFIEAWDYYLALALTRLSVMRAVEEEVGRCTVSLVHLLLGTQPKSPSKTHTPVETACASLDGGNLPSIRSVRRIVNSQVTQDTDAVLAECVHQAWALLKQEAAVRVAVVRALIECAPKCPDQSDMQSIRLFAQLQAQDLCSRLRKVSQDLFETLCGDPGARRSVEWRPYIRTASLAFLDLCLQLATLVANFRDAGLGDGNSGKSTQAQKGSVLSKADIFNVATAISSAADLFDEVLLKEITSSGPGGIDGAKRSERGIRSDIVTALGFENETGDHGSGDARLDSFQCDMLLRSANSLVRDCASDVFIEVFSKASALVASTQSTRVPYTTVLAPSPLPDLAAKDVERFSATMAIRLRKDVEARAPLLAMLQ